MKSVLILLSFFFTPLWLYGVDEIGKQIRVEVIPQWYSKDKVKIYGQISIRKEFNHNQWIRYVVKPSIAYSLDDFWSIRGGLGLHYTDNKDIQGNELPNRFEIRPFQGAKYNYAINKQWTLSVYGRLEERFDFNTQTKDSLNSLRLRLRVGGIYRFDALQAGKYYRAMFSYESFSTLSDVNYQGDEKHRLSIALERSFNHNQKARVEVTWENHGYLYSNTNNQIEYDQIYLRLRYYPTWGTLLNKIRKQD